jgi:hypothetical protein
MKHYLSDDFTSEGFSQRAQGEVGKYAARRDIARNGRGKKSKGKDSGLRKFRPHNHHSQNDIDIVGNPW